MWTAELIFRKITLRVCSKKEYVKAALKLTHTAVLFEERKNKQKNIALCILRIFKLAQRTTYHYTEKL